MKEEVSEIKKEIQEIQEESFAIQILRDYKKQNKRQFVIAIIILIMFVILLAYTIWLLNDIGSIEETNSQNINDIETIENSEINNGND